MSRLVGITDEDGTKLYVNPDHVTLLRARRAGVGSVVFLLDMPSGIECIESVDEIRCLLEGRPPPGYRPPPTSVPGGLGVL